MSSERWLVASVAVFVLVLAACKEASTGSPGPVVRIEIAPKGLLLTQVGAKRQLSVSAHDAEGRVVAAPAIVWRTTTPASITVDEQGIVVAQVANGSSQIFAESQGVSSPPLLVAVTVLPPNTLTVTDAQVVGAPKATDPSAAPVVGATYEVVLNGVDAPAVGTLVVGTEGHPVGGKVVAAQRDGDNVRVTLAVVPVKELLPSLSIKETLDLSNAELEIPSDLKDTYEITREAQTIRFSPRTKKDSAASGPFGTRQQAAKLAWKMTPFECELDATGVSQWPLTLSQAPALSISRKFLLDFVYTSGVGLERLVARGEVGATYDGSLTVALAFQGAVSCTKELAVIRIPVAGVLSWVVGGVVPISVGLELNGKLTLANMIVGAKAEAKAQAEFGVACPAGTNCAFVRSVTGSASAEPVWKKPTGNDLRVDASFAVFGKAEVGIGNPIFPKIRLSAVAVRSGPTLEGSFAPWTEQIQDAGYSSSYSLSLVSKGSVGVDLPKVLAQFGITDITILELQTATQLAQSPKGTLTADRSSFVAGDQVNFKVELDAATIKFPPTVGPYNVKDIILVRKVGASSFNEVGRVSAATAQTSFSIPFTAKDSGQTSDFTAFVMTSLLPFDVLALEVGTGSSCTITDLAPGDGEARAVNNNGQVAGEYIPGGGSARAFLWDAGTLQDLGTLGGASWAYGVNDAKDVVGMSVASSGRTRAFLWRKGAMQDLGSLDGKPTSMSIARGINQAGHVVGASTSGSFLRAFLWSGGVMKDLGALGESSYAMGLNDAGQVVGWVHVGAAYPYQAHAALFSGGLQDLGTAAGWAQSSAQAINASGLIVGALINGENDFVAFSSQGGGGLTALGGAPSYAYGVNDSGVIVGEAGQRAVRWKDGKLEDLTALLPPGSGWTLTRANAINNRGQIVGLGTKGGRRAFLLTCP